MNPHELIKDLLKPNARLYWVDLVVSAAATHGLLLTAAFQPAFSWIQIACVIAATYFGLRTGNFIHELQHAARSIKGFDLGYNLVFGWIARFPSYLYDMHPRHHQTATYGTLKDPELDQWGNSKWRAPWIYLLRDTAGSPLFYFRFGIYPLISWALPAKFNDFVYSSASSVGANSLNQRDPKSPDRRRLEKSDRICGLVNLSLILASVLGWLPWSYHLCAFAGAVGALLATELQSYAFHFYETGTERSDFEGQLQDTLNYPGLFSEVWGPLNSRYHLLHHMYPMLPYHALPEAHRRLMRQLPADHVYVRNQATLWPRLLGWRRKDARKSAPPQSKQSA